MPLAPLLACPSDPQALIQKLSVDNLRMTGRELSFRSQLEEARRGGDQWGQGGQGGQEARKAGIQGGRYVSTMCTGLLARNLALLPFTSPIRLVTFHSNLLHMS